MQPKPGAASVILITLTSLPLIGLNAQFLLSLFGLSGLPFSLLSNRSPKSTLLVPTFSPPAALSPPDGPPAPPWDPFTSLTWPNPAMRLHLQEVAGADGLVRAVSPTH